MSEKRVKKMGGRREGSGRKPFTPTDDERRYVETLAGYGMPHDQISDLLRGGIGHGTLAKYYATELKNGAAKANAKILKTNYEQCLAGNTQLIKLWLRSRLGWTEVQKHQIGGDGGAPIVVKIVNYK